MPLRILIVEDEIIVAMTLEECVEGLGHEVTGMASSAAHALKLAIDDPPDLAFVDINLRDGRTGINLARTLNEHRSVVTVFLTASRNLIPVDFAGAAGVMDKPYTECDIGRALEFIDGCLTQKLKARDVPARLELSPAFRERWRVPGGRAGRLD